MQIEFVKPNCYNNRSILLNIPLLENLLEAAILLDCGFAVFTTHSYFPPFPRCITKPNQIYKRTEKH